jgi:predicted transcriptional regulator
VSSNIPSQLDDVKHTILTCIYENPGIRYRETPKLTGISNRGLEYYLKELETSYEIINVDRSKSKTTRYSHSCLPSEESKILGYLRDDTTIRQILLFILKQVICTFNEIVEYTRKSPSTISCISEG